MSEPTTAIERANGQKLRVVSQDESDYAMMLDTVKFEHALRVANLFSKSDLVPQQYRNNVGNCFIALQQAARMKCDPLMFMQNTYVVHGTPGMEGKLAIALINSRGPFKGPIRFEFDGQGEKRRARAWAIDRETGDRLEGNWVTMDMAKKEGWTKNAKWLSMTDQMLTYRSAVFFGRAYAPECLMGMKTLDELEDLKASGQLRPQYQQSYVSHGDEEDTNALLGIEDVDAVNTGANAEQKPSDLTPEEEEEYGGQEPKFYGDANE